jgi:hypothetical protein
MLNTKFKKIVALASILLLQPMLTPGSFALAKKKAPMRAYSFIAEGGKASQAECDGVRKIPRLKQVKEMSKANSYMGSELQNPELEIKGKPNKEMWAHFFRSKPACNSVLAKTPSALEDTNMKVGKPDLPPEESVESDDEADKSEQADQPDKPEKAEQTEGPDSE